MTVLWVTFGLPFPPDSGARMRDFHLIQEISRNARVVLMSLIPKGGMEAAAEGTRRLGAFCERVETWELPAGLPPLHTLSQTPVGAWRNCFPEAAARIRVLAEAERPDVFQVEHSLLAGYVDALPKHLGCRTVLSLHNVAFEQYRRMADIDGGLTQRLGYRAKAWLMRRSELAYVPRFDVCLTVSPAERDLLTRWLPEANIVIIENGVDCTIPVAPPSDAPVILFAGVMDYPPNADGAVFFSREILPLVRAQVPEARLVIAGQSPGPEVRMLAQEPGVTVTGRVDDMRAYYAGAAVTIAPLRAGGGTRLKILESMALGRPVVSTSMGCEGIDVRNNVHLLIEDEAAGFAAGVVRLLRDRTLRETIAHAGRRLVEERYDWRMIAGKLLAAYSR